MNPVHILGIETSCDETAAAIVTAGWDVCSSVIASSLRLHQETGGVVPEVAARDSALKITTVIEKAFSEAGKSWDEITAIAVTSGPGLLGSLLVGIEASKTLAFLRTKPLIPVFHIAGHIFSNILEREEKILFPTVSLTVAGGHNDLYLWSDVSSFQKLGGTIDDAAGEAFDKGARLLGLPYPGGPSLSKLATTGNPEAFSFPRPLQKSGDYQFSFSGLKTALLYTLRDLGGLEKISERQKADLAAAYQEAIVDTLTAKLFQAAAEFKAREVHLGGGVSANLRLREKVQANAQKRKLPVRIPEKMSYCTDNAAMIAAAGYGMWQAASKKKRQEFSYENIEVDLSHEFRF